MFERIQRLLHKPSRPPPARPPSRQDAPRLVVVPVDDSEHSVSALAWAAHNVYSAQRGDTLALVSVVPCVPGPYPAEVLEADQPAAPSSTVKAWRDEQHAHESETEALLTFMQHHAVNLGVKAESLRHTALSATGGASGVGASLASFLKETNADMVVLGSRGLLGWQRHLSSLLGLGSVSNYVMQHSPSSCAVVIVKGDNS